MLVTGLIIERKKVSQQKHKNLSQQKISQRPFSSQLPQIYQSNKGNKNVSRRFFDKDQIKQNKKQQKRQKNRHSSSNKVSMTTKLVSRKNLSSTKQFQQQRQLTNEKKLSLKEIKQFNSTNKGKSDEKKNNKKKLQIGYKPHLTQSMTNSTTKLALFDEIQKQKITKYFRYYPLIIIQSCLKRQAFMNSLSQTGEIQVFNTVKLAKKNNAKKNQNLIDFTQPWNKLIKIANLKGKYKYRQKFNFSYSAQLKAINFKRKQIKKKKQSDSSSQQEQQKKQKCRDMETWKKAMGVQGAKVFIIKGKYPDFKNALLQRGWVQNPDKHSSFFDLKWTTKVSDITFQSLKSNQIVNHFNNNACLTSKYGICKSLRSIMYTEEVDIDKFFPKAYDLIDSSDFQNFIESYKWVYCQSILKKFVKGTSKAKLDVVKIAFVIINRRLSKAQTIIKHTILQRYFVPSVEEWLAINDQQKDTFDQFYQVFQAWGIDGQSQQSMKLRVKQLLNKLKDHQPQYDLNGSKNIWIVKPAFLSRGRGIKCLSKFNDILNYSLGKQTQYVVQKYIQNPLIIHKKKFDIRQWVLVQDYNPPKIWIYGQFYLRFCIQNYDQTKLANKFAHLTNNSIQKYNKNLSQAQLKQCLKKSMWTQEQFTQFIQQNYPKGSFKIIQQKMRQIVISTILSTIDQVYGRKNSFQLIGYDFMIDQNLNPWLIQINTSPAMDYSTPVTQRLVKMVLQDVAKVVIDVKKKKTKKKTAGLFKCIYNGQDPFISKHYNVIAKNQVQKQNDQQ